MQRLSIFPVNINTESLFPYIFNYQYDITKPIKLTKQQVINKTYRMLVKGYTLSQIAKVTGYSKRTLTYYLEINWNKADTKPELIREEIWAGVCLVITKDTCLISLNQRLKIIYGKLLAKKLINSIRYYYNKFTRVTTKAHLSLQLEMPFYN